MRRGTGHHRANSGRPRKRRFVAIAAGCAALLVTGVLQPLPFGDSARADDDITGPLIAAVNRTAEDVEESLVAAQAAAAALSEHIGELQGQLEPLLAGLQDNPEGALDDIVALVTSEVGSLAGIGLAQAIELVAKVTAPTCSILGTLTATLPDLNVLPVPWQITGPLAPSLEQLDRKVSDALLDYYTQAVTLLLTPTTLPPGLETVAPYLTLAQTLLGLLKINWHTTYYPPDGGDPIVRDTPAFLGLPMVIDADGRTGYDLCGLMNLDLTSGGMTQSISRLPLLSAPKMPLDIRSEFLGGLLTPGYETKDSKAPALFDTAAGLDGGLAIDTNLLKAGDTFDQTLDIIGLAQVRMASSAPPGTYRFASSTPGGDGGSGTQYNYTADVPSEKFAVSLTAVGITLGVAQTPAASAFEFCTSSKGFCSNAPAADSATEQGSMHFLANQPITVDQTNSVDSSACASAALLGNAHLTGSQLYLGHDPTAKADTPGHVWVDTDGEPVSGCLATGSMVGTLPNGFSADDRRAAWQGTGATPPVTAKSGTVNCPSGTAMTRSLAVLGFGLSRYFCSFPPANTAIPTIGGQAFQASVLTAARGTWTPPAPNAPSFAYVWQRCSASGSCADIVNPSPDPTKYTLTAADLNSTVRVAVTGTNPDGHATAFSLPTATITPPPPPANITPPTISGVAGTGQSLTSTDGTWQNSPTGFTRQWLRCAEDGTACVPIPGATSPTYVTTNEDQGHQIKSEVTATNVVNATATATSAGLFIPPPPVLVDLPVINNGSLPATGQQVLEGDHLSVTNGTFTYGATYAQQWLRCDASGASCSAISGATGPAYVAGHDDIGSTIAATVTAANADGSVTADALPTGAVLANSLLGIAPNFVPDGSIAAAAPSDHDTNYVGGSFDTVGPQIGGAGAVPATPTAASRNATLAALVSGGQVNAVASDTAGGYFLGGDFTRVLGADCYGIAHIESDETLDDSYCRPTMTGEVRALDYVKASNITIGSATNQTLDVLVAGGNFTLDDGHANLVFLDKDGSASYAAQGDPDGAVNAIADDASQKRPNFFIGGKFTNIGSLPAKRLAAVAITAAPTAGNPIALTATDYPGGVDCAGGTCTDPVVNTIALVLPTQLGAPLPNITVGGRFDSAYGVGTNAATRVARNNAASWSETGSANQAVGDWNPNPNGPITAITPGPSAGNTGVYLAGDFTSLSNGATTTSGFKGVAEYGMVSAVLTLSPLNWTPRPTTSAATTATASPNTAWKPQIDDGRVLAMVVDGAGVYLGGSFTSVGGLTRHRLAQLPLPSATAPVPAAWDPNAGRTVRSLAKFTPNSGTARMFVGGDFLVLGGETRNNVAELTRTGTFTAWAPAGTDGPVRTLAFAPGVVYVGGEFAEAGSANRQNLAAFDSASAATTEWNPGADGPVHAVTVGGTTIYVGGDFENVGGAGRANLAAVDPAGAATGWNPGTSGTDAVVHAIAVDGTHVYVGGAFTGAGTDGTSGTNLADIDTATGHAATWGSGTDGPVYAIAVSADTVYVGGDFGSAGGQSRTNAAGIARSDGAATEWVPQADGVVRSLLVLGSTVFAGGDFATIGGAPRAHAAQVDNGTGTATGFLPEPGGRVNALTVTAAGAVGIFGDFRTLAGGVRTSGYGFYGG